MRYIPAAMTPISLIDVGKALAGQFNKDNLLDFELTISNYIGIERAYSFTSFMRSIYACLVSIKNHSGSKGNKVLLSRYSCPSFAHGIQAAGMEPVYCEMNPETLSVDLSYLENIDFSDIAAVIGVNFFGLTNPADKISELCKANNVFFIEGLDYSLGTIFKGKMVGTYGDFGILNFQEGKAIPVSGGMVVTKHPELMKGFERESREQRSSNAAMMCGYSIITRPLPYYVFMKASKGIGVNIRKKLSMEDTIRKTKSEFDFSFDANQPLKQLSSFQASLGNLIMENYEEHLEIRLANAQELSNGLKDCPNLLTIRPENGVERIHYVRFPVLISADKRNKVVDALNRNGIEASTMYSDHGIDVDPIKFPGASRIMNEITTIPCHPGVKTEDIERTIAIIKKELN
jgi:perosamine synthetase